MTNFISFSPVLLLYLLIYFSFIVKLRVVNFCTSKQIRMTYDGSSYGSLHCKKISVYPPIFGGDCSTFQRNRFRTRFYPQIDGIMKRGHTLQSICRYKRIRNRFR